MVLQLPNNWRPRDYQKPLWKYLEDGGTRAVEIAHRRWGKDEVALHHAACSVMERPATIWHCLPLFSQARKAIWNAVNPHTGQRRIDEAFPHEIRESTNDQEMFIRFKRGGTWQVIGSDRYDTLVGASAAGVVFSEWALANPAAWGYIRPMVEENNGWALFITTPRGNNHAKSMLDMANSHRDWFAEVSNVMDTGALSGAQLDEAMEEYQALYGIDLGRAMFEQEYLCSFAGATIGAIYGAEMARAEREGRLTTVPVNDAYPVHTVWDLGKAVNNPIWCFQVIKGDLRIVDFYQPESEDLDEWLDELDRRGYHGNDYVPHDILTTEWGQKKTRIERLRERKRKPVRITKVSVADGQQAGRMAINAAVFDLERCAVGIEGLKSYRREWDEDMKRFRDNPVKDWSEHIGSAWRYLGLAWRDEKIEETQEAPKVLEYVAKADGSVQGNMTVKEAVDAMVRRRKQRAE